MTKDIKTVTLKKTNKKQLLLLSLLFDAIGMLTYTIPFLGEYADLIWAPISGILLLLMFKGSAGKIGALVGTIEELIPFTDIIPTFTLTWFYFYIIKRET